MKKYKGLTLLMTFVIVATMATACGNMDNDGEEDKGVPPVKGKVVIATGASNGTSYKMGKEFEKVLQKNNIDVEVLETEGFKKNIELLESDNAELAIVPADYVNGEYDVTDIGEFYKEKTRLLVGKDSEVKDYKGLKGKKVVVGTRTDFSRDEAEMWVNKYNTGDYKVDVDYMDEEGLLEKLKDGTVDTGVMLGNTMENGFRELVNDDVAPYEKKYHIVARSNMEMTEIDKLKQIWTDNKEKME